MSWSDVGGAGTQLCDIQGPLSFDTIVPATNGLYAAGRPSVNADKETVYRIDGSLAAAVRTLANEPWTRVTAMP